MGKVGINNELGNSPLKTKELYFDVVKNKDLDSVVVPHSAARRRASRSISGVMQTVMILALRMARFPHGRVFCPIDSLRLSGVIICKKGRDQ